MHLLSQVFVTIKNRLLKLPDIVVFLVLFLMAWLVRYILTDEYKVSVK